MQDRTRWRQIGEAYPVKDLKKADDDNYESSERFPAVEPSRTNLNR